ncbi:MAG: sigma-70 family RNA polymerase sigma factor [Beijerinckiaceae bacterium]|nr:sigma-70 family RNA polymerase sigma factor [Beijerinckiaceae bacterium]
MRDQSGGAALRPDDRRASDQVADPGAWSLPHEGLSDARLVERSRLGDDDAFGCLVSRYERKLVRVLTRLARDPELARDLSQETFWKVFTHLDRFDTSRRFGPWLFQVGVNLGLDHLRRSRLHTTSIDGTGDLGLASRELPMPDPRVSADLAGEVQHVLAKLPLDLRTVLVLRDLEGFSSAEVASIVKRREATVRWRLAKAREQFRQQWERRQKDLPEARQEARQ